MSCSETTVSQVGTVPTVALGHGACTESSG